VHVILGCLNLVPKCSDRGSGCSFWEGGVETVAHLVGGAERELGLAWEGDLVGAIACVPRVEVGLGAKMTGDGFGWECAVVVGQVMA
jgi:hypothetical protein